MGLANSIRILIGTVCAAGILGWAVARHNFQVRQRVRVEIERQVVEQERKKLAATYAADVLSADEVEIVDVNLMPGASGEKMIVKQPIDPRWAVRFSAILMSDIHESGPRLACLMVSLRETRFYREKKLLLVHELGGRIYRPNHFQGRDMLLGLDAEETIQALVREKTS